VEASEIRVGGRYGVRLGPRLGGRTVEDGVIGFWAGKGWRCLNMQSSRRVTVKTAERFIYSVDVIEQIAEDRAALARKRALQVAELHKKKNRLAVSTPPGGN
jgi:hypothetical protein